MNKVYAKVQDLLKIDLERGKGRPGDVFSAGGYVTIPVATPLVGVQSVLSVDGAVAARDTHKGCRY